MMESRFDTNDFERSLKEQADRFFLIPSERVWKSIYNDLHPGSKWPSLAVGLILFVSLFWIGNTHRDIVNPEDVARKNAPANIGKNTPNLQSYKQSGDLPRSESGPSKVDKVVSIPMASSILKRKNENQNESIVMTPGFVGKLSHQGLRPPTILNIPGSTAGMWFDADEKLILSDLVFSDRNFDKTKEQSGKEFLPIISAQQKYLSKKSEEEKIADTKNTGKQLTQISDQKSITAAITKKKRKHKAEWTIFATPERSNVHFEGSNLNQSASGVVTSPYSAHDMTTTSRFGFQAGTDVSYKINKSIEFTSGFHLNYTGYDILAELAHPSLATVTFRNSKGEMFTKKYISLYGNDGNGSLKIANYNMQFAIPVGLQWTLFEQDNIKVSVVSTVEPFLVLGSKAYILSGDGKKFVNDPDLMRKVNLNGNFSSVITFSSHKVDWKIGPSIRYQFLSTYHNIYPVREHLINYGIRIGISKPD